MRVHSLPFGRHLSELAECERVKHRDAVSALHIGNSPVKCFNNTHNVLSLSLYYYVSQAYYHLELVSVILAQAEL